MHGNRAMKKTAGRGRCGHPYCSGCKTRRGNRRGNRRLRYMTRRLLRAGTE